MPHPAIEKATINNNSELNQDVFLSLFSNTGSLVKQIRVKNKTGRSCYVLNTSNLKAEFYLIELLEKISGKQRN